MNGLGGIIGLLTMLALGMLATRHWRSIVSLTKSITDLIVSVIQMGKK
jgi:hypothetical protein